MTLYGILCHYCVMFTSHLRHHYKSLCILVRKRSMSSYGCGTNMNSIHLLVDFFFPVPLAPSCFWFVVFTAFVHVPRHRFRFLFVFHTSSLFLGVLILSVTSPVYRHWGLSVIIMLRGGVLASLCWALATSEQLLKNRVGF